MEELLELLNKLPNGSENVISNLKVILLSKYPLLKRRKFTKTNFKLIFMGDIQARQEEFLFELMDVNKKLKDEYENKNGRTKPYPNDMLKAFHEWWGMENQACKKMRFEDQKYWQIKSRLSMWFRKSFYLK